MLQVWTQRWEGGDHRSNHRPRDSVIKLEFDVDCSGSGGEERRNEGDEFPSDVPQLESFQIRK